MVLFAVGVFFFLSGATNAIHQKGSRTPVAANTTPSPHTQATIFHHPRDHSKGIRLTGAHDLIIKGENIIGGPIPCIVLYKCYNITIIHNKLSCSAQTGISLFNCYSVNIQNNQFRNVSTGVYVENVYQGRIIVDNNQFLNMQGPYPRGQCVQFNNVNGPGNEIYHNKCENIAGRSNPEDAINLYKSNGTSLSPIMVKGNRIRGGGPSKSGGGIMLGDSGGSYQIALNNILVDPGQYGIAISGGDRNSIIGNIIYGRAQRFTNVGLYVAGYNGAVCTNSTVKLNKVNYFNSNQKSNNSWIGPNTSTPAGWETNTWGAPIGSNILPKIIIN
nr:right-handed parallel beta-helix repeat-containing protein [Mucilaginibacter flavidus]